MSRLRIFLADEGAILDAIRDEPGPPPPGSRSVLQQRVQRYDEVQIQTALMNVRLEGLRRSSRRSRAVCVLLA
jgi:hypothetical protein